GAEPADRHVADQQQDHGTLGKQHEPFRVTQLGIPVHRCPPPASQSSMQAHSLLISVSTPSAAGFASPRAAALSAICLAWLSMWPIDCRSSKMLCRYLQSRSTG